MFLTRPLGLDDRPLVVAAGAANHRVTVELDSVSTDSMCPSDTRTSGAADSSASTDEWFELVTTHLRCKLQTKPKLIKSFREVIQISGFIVLAVLEHANSVFFQQRPTDAIPRLVVRDHRQEIGRDFLRINLCVVG